MAYTAFGARCIIHVHVLSSPQRVATKLLPPFYLLVTAIVCIISKMKHARGHGNVCYINVAFDTEVLRGI